MLNSFRPIHRGRALLSLALVVGCADVDDREAPLELRAAPAGSQVEAACWAVGVLTASCTPDDCPDEWVCPDTLDKDWELQSPRMFADGTQALAGLGIPEDELPLALRRFCHYRPKVPDAQLLEPKLPASIDCPPMQPQGVLGEALDPGLTKVFEVHADADPGSLVPGEYAVDLALVDTHSDRADDHSPKWSHAEAMRRVTDTLTCAGSPCAIEPLHALALPLDADGVLVDPADGVYGTRGQLAIGIVEAVQAHRLRVLADPAAPRRLVLNLSLGWLAEGGIDCGDGEASPWCDDHVDELRARLETSGSPGAIPTRYALEAVHAALLYASCHGALIVAAAGNGRDDSCNEAQMLPAAWGAYAAPTSQQCDALGFKSPDPTATLPPKLDQSWPLVVPVGAVRPDDTPIAATRPGSLTPLMAPGYHVAMPGGDAPLTGTSLSAAAVSGAAALMWSQKSDLDAGQVLQRLYEHAVPLPLESELPMYGWNAATKVRRLAVCASQPAHLGSCIDDPALLQSAIAGLGEDAEAAAASSAAVEHDGDEYGLTFDACSVCGEYSDAWLDPTVPLGRELGFVEACVYTPSTFAFDDAPTLAGPQPNVPVCPDCPLLLFPGTQTAVAYLQSSRPYLDEAAAWRGGNLVILVDGGKAVTITLGDAVLSSLKHGELVAYRLPGIWNAIEGATMNLVLEDAAGAPVTRGNELLLIRR